MKAPWTASPWSGFIHFQMQWLWLWLFNPLRWKAPQWAVSPRLRWEHIRYHGRGSASGSCAVVLNSVQVPIMLALDRLRSTMTSPALPFLLGFTWRLCKENCQHGDKQNRDQAPHAFASGLSSHPVAEYLLYRPRNSWAGHLRARAIPVQGWLASPVYTLVLFSPPNNSKGFFLTLPCLVLSAQFTAVNSSANSWVFDRSGRTTSAYFDQATPTSPIIEIYLFYYIYLFNFIKI